MLKLFRGRGRPWKGFTLIELLVVIAIIAILVSLLLPAVQKVREAANRMKCSNNLKQLGIAAHAYQTSFDGKFPYAAKFDQHGAYTWTHQLLPYMEQQALHDDWTHLNDAITWNMNGDQVNLYDGKSGGDSTPNGPAHNTIVKSFFCPSDLGPVLGEGGGFWGRTKGNYRGCVGPGDVYAGKHGAGKVDPSPVAPGGGLFEIQPGQVPSSAKCVSINEITDGTSNTVMFSEGLTVSVTGWGGVPGDVMTAEMGGSLYSNFDTPNTSNTDNITGNPGGSDGCPGDGGTQADPGYRKAAPCFSDPNKWHATAAARSRHPGGVNACFGDGSVKFISNAVDSSTWRQLGTRAGGEVPGNY